LAFPTGTPIGTSPSFFVSSPTGATNNPIVKISATSATGIGIVTQSSGFTNADGILSNTKINILSWPTISVPSSILRIGARMQGGIVFYIDAPTRKGYVLYEGGFVSTGIVWATPGTTTVTGVSTTSSPASTGVTQSSTNTSLIATTVTGVGAAVSADTFSATVGAVTYTDWALPSEGALNAIYDSLFYATTDPYGLRAFITVGTSLWSSNQGTSNSAARVVTFNTGARVNSQTTKGNSFYALAVREFSF
jgi:hypothetical protein